MSNRCAVFTSCKSQLQSVSVLHSMRMGVAGSYAKRSGSVIFVLCTRNFMRLWHQLPCVMMSQAGLHKKRKQLVIETGPMPDESAVAAAESSSGSSSKPRGRVAAARAAKAAAEQTQQQHDEQRAGQTLRELAK